MSRISRDEVERFSEELRDADRHREALRRLFRKQPLLVRFVEEHAPTRSAPGTTVADPTTGRVAVQLLAVVLHVATRARGVRRVGDRELREAERRVEQIVGGLPRLGAGLWDAARTVDCAEPELLASVRDALVGRERRGDPAAPIDEVSAVRIWLLLLVAVEALHRARR